MLAVGVAFFVLAASRPTPATSSAAALGQLPVRVTILHVNDTHGQLLGLSADGREVGGAARLATAIQTVRAGSTAHRVFLIDGGDVFSRGDDLAVRTAGAANVPAMNHLGFDLWVLGNGEFYDGLDVLRRRMEELEFPTLSANATAGGEPVARPYVIEQAGAARIAFFGLSVVPDSTEAEVGVEEADPIATAGALVPQLRRQADLVVAVTHIGLPEDLRLAAAVEGIDLILGAHSHSVLQHGFRAKGPGGREVLICQAGDHYRYLGQVDVELSPAASGEGYQLAAVSAKLIPIDESVPPDGEMTLLLDKLAAAAMPPPAPLPAGRPTIAAATQPASESMEPAATTEPAVDWPTARPPAFMPLAK